MNKQVKKQTKTNTSEASAQLTAISAADINLKDVANADNAYAVWVRVLFQNWRQGTVSVKDRGEVSYTNKKPWKQKGTGRARAGSARSPLWRGGGIIFGPQPRVRTLKINKKNKPLVLSALIHGFATQGNLFSLDWQLQEEKPSTALAYQMFKSVGLNDKKVTIFLDRNDFKHWASINNLENVQALSYDDVNAYELSLGNCIVVLKKDYDTFKNMVAKWN